MPKKKTTKAKKTTKKPAKKISPANLKQEVSRQLKLDESYMSLVLGAVVVFIIAFLFFALIKSGGIKGEAIAPTPIVEKATPTPKTKVYILQEGEGVWDVAVKFYGDGNKWTVISDVNNLNDDPNSVYPGMKLIVPKE